MLIIFLMRSQGIGPGTTFTGNPFIPTSDQEKISTHNFNIKQTNDENKDKYHLGPLRRIISKILGVKVLRLNKCQATGG